MFLARMIHDTRLLDRVNSIVLNIVDRAQQLALSAVHVRFFLGGAHKVEDAGGFAEDAVHFFEGAAGGFGVEEVDDGEDGSVAGF